MSQLPDGALRGPLRGVVDPAGPHIRPGGRFWTRRIVFRLMAWRAGEGPVHADPITAMMEVPLGTGVARMARIGRGAALAFEARGVERNEYDVPWVRLERLLGPADDDAELRAAAEPFLRRDTVDTAEFGTLVRDVGEDDYEGRHDWHGCIIELAVGGEGQAGVAQARALHARWREWEVRLRALMTAELLPLWREWNADEPEIDGDALYASLTLTSLRVSDDGSVNLMFDPHGQFTDHIVVVDGTVEGGPSDIYIDG